MPAARDRGVVYAGSMTTASPLPVARGPRWPGPLSGRRGALVLVLLAAVVWAFAWGAHEHGAPVIRTDLSAVEPDRRFTIDASTGTLDLASVAVLPGELVEFTLGGSAGAPHAFVLTGADGSEMDQTVNSIGDTVIRLRVPQDGAVSFICAIPGHEGLHGSLVVTPGTTR
jgi:plastocyanin